MRPATRAKLRANAATIHQLGRRYGLRSFVLSTEPGELVATLDEGRSHFDITGFETDLSNILGATVEVVPRGPGVDVEETEQPGRAGVPAAYWRRSGVGGGTRGRTVGGDAGHAAREGHREESSGEAETSTHTIIRYADWHMAPDQSREAPPPLYQLQCTTCEAESDAAEETPQDWAFAHVGRNPSHQHYRETITRFYRMTLVN